MTVEDASPGAHAFYMGRNLGAGEYEVAHDLLHRGYGDPSAVSLTETQSFPFNIPEQRIHGEAYLWWHPNLGVVTGGIWAFRGIKKHHLASEIFDWRTFMSDSLLSRDLFHYRMDNGLEVTMIEPGERFRVHYDDSVRDNKIDIEFTAVMPPFLFADNRHLEQAMRTRGEIVLRGEQHVVDGYTVRDRSWGAQRSEERELLPPMTWMTGVFGDDFAFCCSAFDEPSADHLSAGDLQPPGGKAFVGGFVRASGQTRPLVSGVKRVVRAADTYYPHAIELEFRDDGGRSFAMRGTIIAACGFSAWYNMTVPMCLVQWECDGRTGNGDAQEMQWGDYTYARLAAQDSVALPGDAESGRKI
jgi:hypothetical protein